MDGEVSLPAAADREVTVQGAEADYAVVVAPVIAPDSLNSSVSCHRAARR